MLPYLDANHKSSTHNIQAHFHSGIFCKPQIMLKSLQLYAYASFFTRYAFFFLLSFQQCLLFIRFAIIFSVCSSSLCLSVGVCVYGVWMDFMMIWMCACFVFVCRKSHTHIHKHKHTYMPNSDFFLGRRKMFRLNFINKYFVTLLISTEKWGLFFVVGSLL